MRDARQFTAPVHATHRNHPMSKSIVTTTLTTYKRAGRPFTVAYATVLGALVVRLAGVVA